MLGCFSLCEAFKTFLGYRPTLFHTTTPRVKAESTVNVAKRATAALVSIMVLLIFLSILHIAREHISVWVK